MRFSARRQLLLCCFLNLMRTGGLFLLPNCKTMRRETQLVKLSLLHWLLWSNDSLRICFMMCTNGQTLCCKDQFVNIKYSSFGSGFSRYSETICIEVVTWACIWPLKLRKLSKSQLELFVTTVTHKYNVVNKDTYFSKKK